MANLLDYLDWRGDLTLAQSPFNEVDNLILAELSFVDFSGIVPGPGMGESVPLYAAAEEFFARIPEGKPIHMGVLVPDAIPGMLRKMAAAPRFRNMGLNGFSEHLDVEKGEQFAALSIDCGDGAVYLSFRGTDDTLAGWKEDFALGCQREVPAQREAERYTEAMAAQFHHLRLRLGGHSKGGNLAVYAAAFAPESVQARVLDAYSFDGPGLPQSHLTMDGYLAMRDRLRLFVPRTSIVGMLLAHDAQFTVVKSDALLARQHELYQWEVLGPAPVEENAPDAASRYINETIDRWLETLSPADRERFIDAIFALLSASGATTLQELSKNIRAGAPAIAAAFAKLDNPSRLVLVKGIKLLASAALAGITGGDARDNGRG